MTVIKVQGIFAQDLEHLFSELFRCLPNTLLIFVTGKVRRYKHMFALNPLVLKDAPHIINVALRRHGIEAFDGDIRVWFLIHQTSHPIVHPRRLEPMKEGPFQVRRIAIKSVLSKVEQRH